MLCSMSFQFGLELLEERFVFCLSVGSCLQKVFFFFFCNMESIVDSVLGLIRAICVMDVDGCVDRSMFHGVHNKKHVLLCEIWRKKKKDVPGNLKSFWMS